jgi:prepilin-type N-terminal cleavage/methylation domain-containing protein
LKICATIYAVHSWLDENRNHLAQPFAGAKRNLTAEGRSEFAIRKAQAGPGISDVGLRSSFGPRTSDFGFRRRGFTLLELLLAVMVFAIVLGAIHAVFFSALRLHNRTTDAIERGVPIQQAVAIIKHDLSHLVLPGGTLSGTLQTAPLQNTGMGTPAGQPMVGMPANQMSGALKGQSSPQFYTANGIVDLTSPWADIERVYYYLAAPTNNTPGMDLLRSVTRNLLPTLQDEPVAQFLMSGVEEINFYFHDGTQWRETWDSTTADPVTGQTNTLPRAIKVQLQLASETRGQPLGAPVEIVVPVFAQASTNLTAQASGGGQ